MVLLFPETSVQLEHTREVNGDEGKCPMTKGTKDGSQGGSHCFHLPEGCQREEGPEHVMWGSAELASRCPREAGNSRSLPGMKRESSKGSELTVPGGMQA